MSRNDRARRLFESKPPNPDAWTDELSVGLNGGRTVEESVDDILAANQRGCQHEALIADLVTAFGLSNEDAGLSVDRVGVGIVRAASGNRANCSNRVKDPIAWASFSARHHETISRTVHTYS